MKNPEKQYDAQQITQFINDAMELIEFLGDNYRDSVSPHPSQQTQFEQEMLSKLHQIKIRYYNLDD